MSETVTIQVNEPTLEGLSTATLTVEGLPLGAVPEVGETWHHDWLVVACHFKVVPGIASEIVIEALAGEGPPVLDTPVKLKVVGESVMVGCSKTVALALAEPPGPVQVKV